MDYWTSTNLCIVTTIMLSVTGRETSPVVKREWLEDTNHLTRGSIVENNSNHVLIIGTRFK